MRSSLSKAGSAPVRGLAQARLERAQPSRGQFLEQLQLGGEIAVDIGVRHARLLRDADDRGALRAELADVLARDLGDARFDGFGRGAAGMSSCYRGCGAACTIDADLSCSNRKLGSPNTCAAAKIIHVVSCHAEGEVGDVIVGGVAPPPGETLWEQSRFIARDKTLRNFVLNEPRGGVFRHVNLLVPPKNPKARHGLHHHGARGHAADVGLELDLRGDRAARQRHPADAGAARRA